MSDPADLSLCDAARLIGSHELSPAELTEACLARAERLEPTLRAFTTLDAEGARAQARAPSPGLLHGLPIAIKDLIDVAGLLTTASSRVLANNVAARDAPVVADLRRAGAVITGKTNTQEFAYGVVTAPTLNPWDLERIPGGSSGGSGAAVAAGMSLGALGTDTAGSIRIPAALCGITGLKPRTGSVPMEGIIPLSWTLDSCGPMARSAADVELMWRAMTGAPEVRAKVQGLRLATPTAPGLAEVDPELEALFEAALATLTAAGARRAAVEVPTPGEWKSLSVLLAAEALSAHREAGWYPERAEDCTEETFATLRHAESFTAVDVVTALRDLDRTRARQLAALEGHDLLALPTTTIAAPTRAEVARMTGTHFRPPIVGALTRLCGHVNWCRLASVSVPCGFTEKGLPIGLQLIARDEATALSAALGYQAVTDFHTCRPPLVG